MTSLRKRLVTATGLLLALCVGFCASCVRPVKGLYPPDAGAPKKRVYVVSHGWHTGLVIERADIPRDVWPQCKDFPNARFLEVGWGDAVFYQSDDPSFGVTCKAAFWPTPSALHVVAFHQPLKQMFPESEIIEIALSTNGFENLCLFVGQSYAIDEDGEPVPLGPSLYGDGKFYRANGKFYLPKSCNGWTARALRSAGCPISPVYGRTAGNVIWQVRKFGEVIQKANDSP